MVNISLYNTTHHPNYILDREIIPLPEHQGPTQLLSITIVASDHSLLANELSTDDHGVQSRIHEH